MAFHLTRGKVNRSSLVVVMFQGYVLRVYLITKDNQSALWENSWIDRWLIWIFELCIYHRPSPGGGDPGQIQRWMGTYTGIWTINLPWRRGKWGRFVFQKPCTAGKTGDFANETFFPFQVNCRKKMRMRCLSIIVICAPLEHYWILIGLSFMICCQ